jgi:hypothetical protein
MSNNLASLHIVSFRRAALAGVVALAAAAVSIGAAPAAAMNGGIHMHSGFGGFHHGFGGFHHGFGGFHHGFGHRFGFGFFPGYAYNDYADDDGCYRRVWGPYGWRFINVCQ